MGLEMILAMVRDWTKIFVLNIFEYTIRLRSLHRVFWRVFIPFWFVFNIFVPKSLLAIVAVGSRLGTEIG